MNEDKRTIFLNNNKITDKKYIIYWMQASQRTQYNHALEKSKKLAKKYKKPLIVFFGITDNFPDANIRHYTFMLQGLKEVKKNLEKQNISFIIQHVSPEKQIIKIARKASILLTDQGYLKIQKQWRQHVAKNIKCPMIQVESDVIVPVEVASNKEEYSAATFRPKINKKIKFFLKPEKQKNYDGKFVETDFDSINLKNISSFLKELKVDKTVKKVEEFKGGTSQAKKFLKIFLKEKIDKYSDYRNEPSKNYSSNLSPYLHFGQISPIYIAFEVKKTKKPGAKEFLEELIVRRELAINFVHFNKNYDNYKSIPSWAKETLKKHEKDKREYSYSLLELENAETHDSYWNAAQKQMTKSGKMHGYMRMYWGKKIIEWTHKPKQAFNNILYLNNKYELDGRDPNGYAGIAWCFGKHDHPWKERLIFGKIRYMNAKGLERKFNIKEYVKKNKINFF